MSDLIERLKAELAAVQDNRWGAAPVSISQQEAREIIAALLERDGDLPPENPQKEYAEWRKRGNKIIDLKRQLAQARRQGREDAADAARFRAITNGISISAEDKRALVVMIPEAQAKAEGTTVLDELRKAIDEVGADHE